MPLSFPLELCDLIIQYIDDDVDTLKTCSLVSAAFCQFVQPRIFSRVTLLPPRHARGRNVCSLFHCLVTQSPHIQPYVRTLVILDINAPAGRKQPMILEEPTLPPLLQMLPKLEGLHIHARIQWSHLEEKNAALAAAILTALSSSDIKSIYFLGTNGLPITYITQSPRLKDLLLNHLELTDGLNPVMALPGSTPPPKICLRRLGLGPGTLVPFATDYRFDMTCLRKLRVSPTHHISQHAALQTLLDRASQSLLEFECLPFPTADEEPHDRDMDLSKLSSLRRLVVWVVSGIYRLQPFAPFLWLTHALDSLTADSALEHIVIHLDPWYDVVPTIDEPAWTTLDASLTRPELNAAIVTIFTSLDLEMVLPRLSSSGRMRIDNTKRSFDSLRYSDL
ncbi:hypothetical protein C8R45DRAFT_967042 [Mycena sanguinolenta]|nr:hypothetical protein C8R45DRAFT_967042 [Mycena sanguinolenta]